MTLPDFLAATADPDDATPIPDPPGIVAWRVTDGLHQPAGAYYDDGSRFVYVPCSPGPAGTGSIARLTPDGKVAAARWVAGLDAPGGMRSFKGTLHVACGGELVAIDVARAEVTGRVPVPGAALGAVAVDGAGTVYACDRAAGRIYASDGRTATVFAEGPDLEHPNGLLAIGNQLFVAGSGAGDAPGRVFAVNLKTRQKTLVTPYPVGHLGGLERDERCNFLVADGAAGRVYLVSPRGEVTQVLAGGPGAAGHGLVPDRRLLLVARPGQNAVTAYDLSKIRK